MAAGPKYVLHGAFGLRDGGLAVPLGEMHISRRNAELDVQILAERGVDAVACEVTIRPPKD